MREHAGFAHTPHPKTAPLPRTPSCRLSKTIFPTTPLFTTDNIKLVNTNRSSLHVIICTWEDWVHIIHSLLSKHCQDEL